MRLTWQTSVAAFGKIRLAQREGSSIPADWAVAPDGGATTDPAEAMGGALLPMGGSKGSALALMVEMLAGVLAGAAIGRNVGNPNDRSAEPADVGHAFMVLDVAAFMPRDVYEARTAEMGAMVRASRPSSGHEAVRLPGAGAVGRHEQAMRHGLELPDETVAILTQSLAAVGLSLPAPRASAII